jgi:hypothetical protein
MNAQPMRAEFVAERWVENPPSWLLLRTERSALSARAVRRQAAYRMSMNGAA